MFSGLLTRRRTAATLAAVAVMTGLTAGPQLAADPAGDAGGEPRVANGKYEIQTMTGTATRPFCVDVDGGGAARGVNIRQWECNNVQTAQRFYVTDLKNGYYRINTNTAANRCVDVEGVRPGSR